MAKLLSSKLELKYLKEITYAMLLFKRFIKVMFNG